MSILRLKTETAAFEPPFNQCVCQISRKSGVEFWNSKDLARIDLVGMRQHRRVGLEDRVVLRAFALAIVCFGYLPEVVAFLDCIEDGFFFGLVGRSLDGNGSFDGLN